MTLTFPMKQSPSWRILTIVAAVVCLLAAAGPADADDTKMIAVVNGDSITTDAMAEELGRIHMLQMEAANRSDFSLDRLLQRLINNRLMAQEAELIGLGEDSVLVRRVREYREGLAYRALLKDITPDSITISAAELQAGFAEHFRRYRMTFVSVADSGLCAALGDSVRMGVSMNELATRHSLDKFKKYAGDAGAFALIDLPIDLQPQVRRAAPGELLPPFFMSRVWVLARVDAELSPDSAVYDSVATGLRGYLQEQKRKSIRRDFVARTRTEIPVTVDSAQVDSVLIVMMAGQPASEQPVVRVGEQRVLTAAEIRNKYAHRLAAASDRPAREVLYETLTELTETMLLKEAAARQNYLAQPRFDVAVAALRDSLLVMRYLEDVIGPTVTVPDSAVENFYQANQQQYREPSRVKIATITHQTADSAQTDYEKLKAGADFTWLAKQTSSDTWNVVGGVHDWMTLEQFPLELRTPLDTMAIGTFLPPTSLAEGEIIFKLVDREPGAIMPFDRVAPRIRSGLTQRAQLAAIDRAMQELRKTAEIEINDEALKSLRVSGPQEAVEEEAPPAGSHGHMQP